MGPTNNNNNNNASSSNNAQGSNYNSLKRPKVDFKAGLPDLVGYPNRYCPLCRYVLENHRQFRHGTCVKCNKDLPLSGDFSSTSHWWCRCVNCNTIIRCEFLNCEFCGTDVTPFIKSARIQRAYKQSELAKQQAIEQRVRQLELELQVEKDKKENVEKELDTLKVVYASVLSSADPAELDLDDEMTKTEQMLLLIRIKKLFILIL